MQWNLYSSGICQAKIYVQDIIYFEMFNPFSKDFYTKKILDEDENKKFKENFRIDILSFLEKYKNLSYTSYKKMNSLIKMVTFIQKRKTVLLRETKFIHIIS